MLRVILVGYGELISSLLLGVIESGHKVVGALRWERIETDPFSLFLKDLFWQDHYLSLLRTYKIPEIKAKSVNNQSFIKQALKLEPDMILVGSWGEILKKETIILPKIACVNCHPSLLPAHRGANPYASVIKNGENVTGITFHLVDKKIDSGPILIQKEVNISSNDTGESLRMKCSFKARETVKELLDGLECAKFLPKKQDESKASYFPRLNEDDARISWNKPAEEIHNQIRGLYPWMKCYTSYKSEFLMINESRIIELNNPVSESGKILYKTKNSLTVSTSDPYKAVTIGGLKIYGFGNNLWSSFYIDKMIKIGDFLGEI